jgi:CheY-like chemotaxis protein
MLHSDPALLLRIVENFVTNAIRYTETGNVDVCSEIRGENARIEVRDSGVGIPKQAIETIFDEYFQLDNPERNRNKGLGLGLSIAKHIGLLLGHRLEVTSILGEGTIFSVDVPLGKVINQVVEVSKLDKVTKFQKHSPVVLFIDDDPAIVDATTMLLNICGFQVHSALNGDEAMAHIVNGVHSDIVVSDYRLPGYSGIEVIRRIRQASIDELPTNLITGNTSSREIAKAKLSKCTQLHKPVDTDHLISLIETLTAKSVVV